MKSILIIDDNDDLRIVLKEIFEDLSYEVREASNGMDGLSSFRKNPTDIVITDIFMPEKDGMETIRDLQKEFPGTKIIAMTGVNTIPMNSLK